MNWHQQLDLFCQAYANVRTAAIGTIMEPVNLDRVADLKARLQAMLAELQKWESG